MGTNTLKACGKEVRVEGRLIRVGRLDGDKYVFLDDPELAIQALRRSRIRIDIFTFIEKVTQTLPKYSYPMEWDNLAVLPVSTFDYWWAHQIRFAARNRARQAEKRGVTLREIPFDNTLVRGIWEIYNECPVRQGRPFTHFGKDLETVHKAEATFLDQSIFIGAFLKDRMIGFVKLVMDDSRTQANLMNIVSMVQYKDMAPTNALIAQAVRSCAERNIPFLVYQNFSYGKKPADGLSIFKEKSGFRRVDLPRYYVPLTLLGSIALRLGLHHRLVDHIPDALSAKLRQLRNNWYNQKFHALTEAS